MTSDSELRNLGEALQVTFSKMVRAGVKISRSPRMVSKSAFTLTIEPMTICEKCNNWSPADRCLWCKPDEFDGEGVA